jgi:hypothetical protein
VGVLFYVQNDREWMLVRRRGRFSVPRDCVHSPAHLEAAIREAQERMIAGLKKTHGLEYVDHGFDLRGPLPHLSFSEDTDPDPGPAAMPDPRDVEAWERWERAERARLARLAGEAVEMVDFELVASFRAPVPTQFHVAARGHAWR